MHNRSTKLPYNTHVLLEAIHNHTAPAAIISTNQDFFFALASVVAEALYAQSIPLIALEEAEFSRLHTGDRLSIRENGSILVVDS